MIEIDGSYGEGGGQVLRTALSLSTLTGRGVHIHDVRANRSTPGLAPQHLTGVRALAGICDAEVAGDTLRSTDVTFQPRSAPHAGTFTIDVTEAAEAGSAGSVTLLAQALLIPLLFATGPSTITLRGGTHVLWSPSFEYLDQVYLSALARCGLHAEASLSAWGFYPVGQGQITLTVTPIEQLQALTLTQRGALERIAGVAVASNLPSHIPQRMTDRARSLLSDLGVRFAVQPKRVTGAGPGAGIFLIAEYEHVRAGFAGHGKQGKPSEVVAEEACEALLAHHRTGAPVDVHLADQLLVPLALAAGRSEFRTARITPHLRTNAHIITRFVDAEIAVEDAGTVVVHGAGYTRDQGE